MKIVSDKNKTPNKHNIDLGYYVPSDYFEQSKKMILIDIESESAINKSNAKESRFLTIVVAASVVVLVSLAVFNDFIFKTFNTQIAVDTINQDNTIIEDLVLLDENDLTISSLFMNDDKIDELVELQMVEDLLSNKN